MGYKAPFPYFGGKSTIASEVWQRFGNDIRNYVEPFFGSGAVLLNRPDWSPDATYLETVNDKSGFLANFWRSVRDDPEQVAYHADWPTNENDLHARHIWLVNQADSLSDRLEGDPDYYDAKIAGWWVWGAACWIGGGWCSGRGPWQSVDGKMTNTGDAGRGVKRQRIHLGDAGQGVNRQRIHLGNAGSGEQGLYAWMESLSERLRRVRVCCGDWSRVCGPTPTYKIGLTGVFLDPLIPPTQAGLPTSTSRTICQSATMSPRGVRPTRIIHYYELRFVAMRASTICPVGSATRGKRRAVTAN